MPAHVEHSSLVAAPADEVWARAVTPEGINHELSPMLRMTMPRSLRGMTIDDAPLGERLGRSWILLFGLIPVDWDDLCLAELEPGRRFLERSTMLSMRSWQHERIVEPGRVGQTTVRDRLTFELRRPLAWIPGSHRFAAAVVRRLFRHRHRRLGRWAAVSGP
jgi:ligand-binding SRPBCC domain-containing protein